MFAKKLIWSVDVSDSPETEQHALYLLGALSRATGVAIEPVYVLNSPYTRFAGDPPENLGAAVQVFAEKKLLELSRGCDLAKLSAGKVLCERTGSVRKQVQCLLDFAEAERADAIVVATHARKGVRRMFLGSFAETLALHSTIPIFTVNPETKVRERISKILFPTTFQPKFRPAFEQVVEMAKALGASLTLFYKEPFIPSPFMSTEIYTYIEAEAGLRKQDAIKWQEWAKHNGVPTEIHLDNQAGSVAPAIETYASEHNFDLIAMVSQADALSSIVTGSATRQVIRDAPCPVWIVRAKETK